MRETTIHRVDGVGKQTPPDTDQPFDPRTFEQGIHGLQKLVMDIARLDHRINPKTDEPGDYNADHEHGEEDGQQVIHIDEESILYDIIRLIPYKWDVSVLTDLQFDNSFAVRTSADCGGGINIWATIIIQDGMFSKLNVGHTCLEDPDEMYEITDLSANESSRVLTHVNRYLEREVNKAYAKTIGSAATAFDFIATKEDIPPIGSRPTSVRDNRERHSQKEWATIRGKTQQTVSDNVRDARSNIRDIPDAPAFKRREPALIELDEDADENGDIRLV